MHKLLFDKNNITKLVHFCFPLIRRETVLKQYTITIVRYLRWWFHSFFMCKIFDKSELKLTSPRPSSYGALRMPSPYSTLNFNDGLCTAHRQLNFPCSLWRRIAWHSLLHHRISFCTFKKPIREGGFDICLALLNVYAFSLWLLMVRVFAQNQKLSAEFHLSLSKIDPIQKPLHQFCWGYLFIFCFC